MIYFIADFNLESRRLNLPQQLENILDIAVYLYEKGKNIKNAFYEEHPCDYCVNLVQNEGWRYIGTKNDVMVFDNTKTDKLKLVKATKKRKI